MCPPALNLVLSAFIQLADHTLQLHTVAQPSPHTHLVLVQTCILQALLQQRTICSSTTTTTTASAAQHQWAACDTHTHKVVQSSKQADERPADTTRPLCVCYL